MTPLSTSSSAAAVLAVPHGGSTATSVNPLLQESPLLFFGVAFVGFFIVAFFLRGVIGAAVASLVLSGATGTVSTLTDELSSSSNNGDTADKHSLTTTAARQQESDWFTRENPLWPSGVSSSDVDELVDDCLKDPQINIKGVPDYLERQLYKATIMLVMNSLYRVIGGAHGHQLLGHKIQLSRNFSMRTESRKQRWRLRMQTDVEAKLLEEVAERLISNKHVNLPLIPDSIERPLYVNCLKLIFRVLDLLSTSLRVTLCGHDVRVSLSPSTRLAVQTAALKRASAMSSIDMERMHKFARTTGKDSRWFWNRFLSPANNDFIAQIHASLFCLMLGVLDDLLDNTEIQVLSDTIHFDIVSTTEFDNAPSQTNLKRRRMSHRSNKGSQFVSLFSFGLGIWSVLSCQAIKDKILSDETASTRRSERSVTNA